MSDSQLSARVAVPLAALAAVGAAWLLMSSPGDGDDAGPTSIEQTAASRQKVVRTGAPVLGTEVAARPVGEAAPGAREPRGASLDRLRERLQGGGITNAQATRGVRQTVGAELGNRVRDHLAEAPARMEAALERYGRDAGLDEAALDGAYALADELGAQLADIGQRLDDGSLTPEEARREVEQASDRTLKKMSDALDGDVPDELRSALASPGFEPPPEPPTQAQGEGDDWWSGQPLDPGKAP